MNKNKEHTQQYIENYVTSDFSSICILKYYDIDLIKTFLKGENIFFEFRDIFVCEHLINKYINKELIVEPWKYDQIKKEIKSLIFNKLNNK